LQVELQVEAIHVISRAEPLPFEVIDASRGDEEVAAAAAKGEQTWFCQCITDLLQHVQVTRYHHGLT